MDVALDTLSPRPGCERFRRPQNFSERNAMLKAEDIAVNASSDNAADLEFGLDVMECLAESPSPKTLLQIANHLNRPVFELSRIIRALENRRYIFKTGKSAGYTVTAKAHNLGIIAPYIQKLLDYAPTITRTLCDIVYQSCNLSIPSNDHMVVIAQTHSSADFGINVPIGFRYDMNSSAAGLVFLSFDQHSDNVEQIKKSKVASGQSENAEALQIVGQGFAKAKGILDDVQDLSCPILYDSQVVAALTVPYLPSVASAGVDRCLDTMLEASSLLSAAFRPSILRPVSSH